jgi:hypothetical protein
MQNWQIPFPNNFGNERINLPADISNRFYNEVVPTAVKATIGATAIATAVSTTVSTSLLGDGFIGRSAGCYAGTSIGGMIGYHAGQNKALEVFRNTNISRENELAMKSELVAKTTKYAYGTAIATSTYLGM